MELIDKEKVIAEINSVLDSYDPNEITSGRYALVKLRDFLDTLEVKEVDLTDRKTDWRPSNKQIESLHDMLKYNIGVFDYQKFMEVNSLYDDLTKILDYETDRQK